MTVENYDVVVVGAGPGGYVAAIRCAQLGLKTAIIEREHLGGICLNWGCIPTKALLRSAEILHYAQNSSAFGIEVQSAKPNMKKIVERSRKVADQLSSGIKSLLKKNKVTVYDGFGSVVSPTKVKIEAEGKATEINTKNIILATGARARNLINFEADKVLVVTYKDAMIQEEIPRSLVIVGSGAIGMEFASFYRNLGSEVTILEVADRILQAEDVEISTLANKAFTKQGMNIHTKVKLNEFVKGKKNVEVKFEVDGKQQKLLADKVIMAVGIIPNTENLGLEKTKAKLDEKGLIVVNEFNQTAEPNIFAIGDIVAGPWLAHKASHEGIMVAENIAKLKVKPLRRKLIPGCTYSMPQIASIGYTEAQAVAAGHQIKVGKFPFIGNGKAIALGEPEGLIKTIFDQKTGELLGAHMIGAEVTELIQGYAIAMTLEATEEDLFHTIFPHPTLSEMMHESALQAYNKAIHI